MGGEIRPFFLVRQSEKSKIILGEGYAFLNHGDAESPGIEKSGF